ncbi:MAG: DUF1501 domain-containing protein [Planctomycetota bacterium]
MPQPENPRSITRKSAALPTRRDALYGLGAGLGSIALSALLRGEAHADSGTTLPSFVPRAKSCIFLLMEGGPSHIDTFDPKPKLDTLHRDEFRRKGRDKSAMESGRRYYVRSPFPFRKAGTCGADMNELWRELSGVADDICFFRGCQGVSVNHPTALYHMNTGNRFGGDPAVGSWVNYGLGSESKDLPGFVVLPELAFPQGGPSNWSNGFLPAEFQGTPLRPEGSPILDLLPPPGVTREQQRKNLDLLAALNRKHRSSRPGRDVLRARVESFELAYRMQTRVPGILDLDGETERTKELYGVGKPETDGFARKCLLARRLVERGVRFVQLYRGTWDSHDYIERAHRNLIRSVDRPIAALIRDLKERGLLDDTLIVWCGEFGRSPDNGVRGGIAYGRDHNPHAMPMWFAGGGVNAGNTIGATDEIGARAVDAVHPIRDVHVTILKLLGLDDRELTYYHAGRYKQLSQFGGQVIDDLMA